MKEKKEMLIETHREQIYEASVQLMEQVKKLADNTERLILGAWSA